MGGCEDSSMIASEALVIMAVGLKARWKATTITRHRRLGHSQLIFNSAFQLMNEEQEGGRLLILNFNFIGL